MVSCCGAFKAGQVTSIDEVFDEEGQLNDVNRRKTIEVPEEEPKTLELES